MRSARDREKPVKARYDGVLPGGEEGQTRGADSGQLRPVGVAAGLLLGEDTPTSDGGEGIELALEFCPLGVSWRPLAL
ncbi:hypothetical protein BDK92_7640 [Micromonospora pisi]|uniref:Uncharacterized protein n=1 Tax=Micromonospora pisi TaxID=589240 RepID=A0A495JVR7_9ACTN|nr:hypothetical protein BDK92_7640 [Micromonospora pisi]